MRKMEDKLKAVKELDLGLMAQIRGIKDDGVRKILVNEAKRELHDIISENLSDVKVKLSDGD